MGPAEERSSHITQEFEDANGNRRVTLPTSSDNLSEGRCVLWCDILDAFPGVDHIEDHSNSPIVMRVFFVVGGSGGNKMIHPPRIPYCRHGYRVVMKPVMEPDTDKVTDPLHHIRMELKTYMDLQALLSTYNFRHSRHFSEYSATKDYYRTTLLGNLSVFDSTDPLIQDEKVRIEQEVMQLDQQFPCFDEFQSMMDFSKVTHDMFRRPPNRFFLVLPANLDQWDAADTAVQAFRLYFICAHNSSVSSNSSAQHYHFHISSHPGYDLNRLPDFLRQHGRCALAVLFMVKYGFFTDDYSIPKLNTIQILSTVHGVAPRHQLTKDNIGLLIEKAISYIQAFVCMNGNSRLTDDVNLSDVRSFLQLEGADSGTGDLSIYQHADDYKTWWICVEHFPQDPGTEPLRKFVMAQGGTVDLHHSTIRIQLTSKSQADRLATFRMRRKCHFEIFLYIAWSASAEELQKVIDALTQTGFHIVHVYGIEPSAASQDKILFRGDETNLTILYGYPRSAENRVAISLKQGRRHEVLGLHLQKPTTLLDIDWRGLMDSVDSGFCRHGTRNMTNLTGVDVFEPETNRWQGRYGVTNGTLSALQEAAIPNTRFSDEFLERGTLSRLELHSHCVDEFHRVLSLMACNPQLRQCQIPDEESSVLSQIDTICQHYRLHENLIEVTFMHRADEILAKVIIGGKANNYSSSSEADQDVQSTPNVNFIKWQLDHVHGPMRDRDVQLLLAPFQIFPFVLTSFTMDISSLSLQGLAGIQSILRQSTLECLHVKCVSLMLFEGTSIAQTLQAIQWSTIKSLMLSGDNIDGWLWLWATDGGLHDLIGAWVNPAASGPCLVSLHVIGSGQRMPELSHASALAIHHLVYSSRLVDLRLENVLLHDIRDWDLVLGGIHYSKLKRLALKKCNVRDYQRRKAVVGRPFLSLKDRVGGWIRNTL